MPSKPLTSDGSGSGSVFAFLIFLAMVSASSVRLMRVMSDSSDFDIFLRAVAQAHHPRRRTGDQRLGQRKEAAFVTGAGDRSGEVVVEFLRDVAGELEMLLLVLADGHVGGVIEQNVRGHQVRVDVKPG